MSPAQPERRALGRTGGAVPPSPARLPARNIGEVLAELSSDYAHITASKIRFLEEKGLIRPQRTATGYRKYAGGDVDRLRFILALQRDQYLPLKVIKDYLDAIDRGERPEALPAGVSISPRMVSASRAGELRSKSRQLTLEELKQRTKASPALIQELISYGLIGASDDLYDENSLKVTAACVQLYEHGIEPRHLRPFRAAAEREVGLAQTAVAPLASRKDTASRARAADTARQISDICLSLHSALVRGEISRMDS